MENSEENIYVLISLSCLLLVKDPFIFLVSPFNNYSGIVPLYLMTMQKLVLQPVYIV